MKTICRQSIIITLNFLFVSLSFGQKNMQPGYIFSLKGDTIKGYIDYRNWEKNPKSISFGTTKTGRTSLYKPINIKGFTVANDTYISGKVTIDDSPHRVSELKSTLEYNYISDTAFLLSLIQGEKSLLYYLDNKSKEHFFIRTDTGFSLLIYKPYLKIDGNGNMNKAEDKRFIGQLIIYLQECKNIQSKLQFVKYDKKSLTDIFEYYYSCTNNPIDKPKKGNTDLNEFGVFVGLALTQFDFLSGPVYMADANYSLSKNFTTGVFFNLVLPRHSGRFVVANDIQYYSFNTEANYSDPDVIATTQIGLHYIQMNNMFQYRYPIGSTMCYINAGVSSGFGFSEKTYETAEIYFNDTFVRTVEGKAVENMNKAYLGIPVGIGVKYKKYSFDIRYVSGFKKQDDINVAYHPFSKTNSMFFLLKYQF
jgi:hypothetical protein